MVAEQQQNFLLLEIYEIAEQSGLEIFCCYGDD